MNSQMKLIEKDFDTVLVAGSIKTAMKDSGSGSRDLWQVPIDQIKVVPGLNPRVMNDAYRLHVRALADSMKTEGYYQDQPLAGYVAKEGDDQVIYVYSGHSRLAGAKLANSEGAEIIKLPVVVSIQGLSMEDITVSIIRGNGGKSLSYYESAVVCKRLVRYGMEIEDIAARTGITAPLIKNRLLLMSAPARLREMVANDEMSATLAIEMFNKHGSNVMDTIKGAVEVAGTEGKSKVRKAQTTAKPDVFNRAKFVKKAAPRLFEAADLVRKDPGFAGLTQDTRELLDKLLSEIRNDKDDQDKSHNASGEPTDEDQN
jgi:ParB family transcriptional regulator, chromosome partitioning protein